MGRICSNCNFADMYLVVLNGKPLEWHCLRELGGCGQVTKYSKFVFLIYEDCGKFSWVLYREGEPMAFSAMRRANLESTERDIAQLSVEAEKEYLIDDGRDR